MHKDVMSAVSMMGFKYEEESIVGIYAVDIAVPDLSVAIEIDGPSHFTRTVPHRRLGPDMMRRRHLTNAGWTVFSISLDEWSVHETSQQRLNDLRDLLMQRAKAELDAGPLR